MVQSQIVIPSRFYIEIPRGGDFYAAEDFNQFSPLEFLIGYFWQLPYKEKRIILKEYSAAIGSDSYSPTLNGVEAVLDRHKESFVSDLEDAVATRTASGTKLRSAALLRFKEDTITSPSHGDFTRDKELEAFGLKIYLEYVYGVVKSISHSHVRGPNKVVLIDKNTIDRFAEGQTPFLIEGDIQAILAHAKTQRRAGITSENHLLTRNVAAVLSRYAAARNNPDILPYDPTIPNIIMEAFALYYLGKGNMARQYSIDMNLLDVEGFANQRLISLMEDHKARRFVQRHNLAKAKNFGREDRLLKDAYVNYLQAHNYMWLGYVVEFPGTPLESVAEKWITPPDEQRPIEVSLVFGEKVPPLVIRRFPKPGDRFDYYAKSSGIVATLDKSQLIIGDQIRYRGKLYDPNSGYESYASISRPNLDRLPLYSTAKSRVHDSIEKRIADFVSK